MNMLIFRKIIALNQIFFKMVYCRKQGFSLEILSLLRTLKYEFLGNTFLSHNGWLYYFLGRLKATNVYQSLMTSRCLKWGFLGNVFSIKVGSLKNFFVKIHNSRNLCLKTFSVKLDSLRHFCGYIKQPQSLFEDFFSETLGSC